MVAIQDRPLLLVLLVNIRRQVALVISSGGTWNFKLLADEMSSRVMSSDPGQSPLGGRNDREKQTEKKGESQRGVGEKGRGRERKKR